MDTFTFKIYPFATESHLGPDTTLKLSTDAPLSQLINEALDILYLLRNTYTQLYRLNQHLFVQDNASYLISREFLENTEYAELIDQSDVDITLASLSKYFSTDNINHIAFQYYENKTLLKLEW